MYTSGGGRVVKIATSPLILPDCFSPARPYFRLLPFNYSVIFKKSRRRTACSSRGSSAARFFSRYILCTLLENSMDGGVLDTTSAAEPFQRIGERRKRGKTNGRQSGNKEATGETVIVNETRQPPLCSRFIFFFFSLSNQRTRKLITAISPWKILSR